MQPIKLMKFWRQFTVLVQRNLRLILNDKLTMASLILQAPFMVLVIKMVVDPDCFTSNLINIGSRTALFIISAMAAFMGTLNSYREICKEREIILREASVGVSLLAVVLSKAFVLLLIEDVQAAILTFGFVRIVHIPQNHLLLDTNVEIFVSILLMLVASSAIGLLISAIFKSGVQRHPVHADRGGRPDRGGHRLPLGHGRAGGLHRPEQPPGLAEARLRQPYVRCHGSQPDALLADDGAYHGGMPHRRLAGAADFV